MFSSKADFKEGELEALQKVLTQFTEDSAKLHTVVGEFFVKFDESKDGFLDRKELRHFMENFFKQFNVTVPLNDDFVFHTFIAMDQNHDGKISPEELEQFATKFVADLLAQLKSLQ